MLESELFNLLENTRDAAFSLSESGEVVSWNKAAEKLFGFSAQEALHSTCFHLLEGIGPLGTHVCHENCTILECAGKKEAVPDFDLSVKTRDGQRIWVNVSTIVFHNERTGRRLVVHMARDITRRKKAEDMAQRVLEVSKQLVAEAEAPASLDPVSPLSDQESEILKMFAEGAKSAAIVRKLKISPQTLRNHLYHINQKLGTHNRLEAVMHALQRKLI